MIELNHYDKAWLMGEGLSHEDIAKVEDYLARYQAKFPHHGDCTACMAAYKRFMDERKQAKEKARIAAIRDAKLAQAKRNGLGKDFQQGVWAPFNGKTYYDKAKMVADAKAMGLEEAGNEKIRAPSRQKYTPTKSMQQSLYETLKTMQ